MTSIPIIGRIYHVVNKVTGVVVKVGSTIRSLEKRWEFYSKNFSNHFLLLVKEIESSEEDWYDSDNSDCPFLWHLAAAEHLEICRMRTINSGPLSNKISPLVQKHSGFDANEASKAGGLIGGAITRDKKLGIHNPNFDRRAASRKGGLRNVESGHLKSISSKGGKVAGSLVGTRNRESGWMKKVQLMGLGKGGKIGGPKGMHTRWHVNRGIVSNQCKYCVGTI